MLVQVSGWLNPRRLTTDNEGRVWFEVALQGHCPACKDRIDQVRDTVDAKGLSEVTLEEREENSESKLFAILPPPPVGTDLREYVAMTLNLRIISLRSC